MTVWSADWSAGYEIGVRDERMLPLACRDLTSTRTADWVDGYRAGQQAERDRPRPAGPLCVDCEPHRRYWQENLPHSTLPWPGGELGAWELAGKLFQAGHYSKHFLRTPAERLAEWDARNREQIRHTEDICHERHAGRPRSVWPHKGRGASTLNTPAPVRAARQLGLFDEEAAA